MENNFSVDSNCLNTDAAGCLMLSHAVCITISITRISLLANAPPLLPRTHTMTQWSVPLSGGQPRVGITVVYHSCLHIAPDCASTHWTLHTIFHVIGVFVPSWSPTFSSSSSSSSSSSLQSGSPSCCGTVATRKHIVPSLFTFVYQNQQQPGSCK